MEISGENGSRVRGLNILNGEEKRHGDRKAVGGRERDTKRQIEPFGYSKQQSPFGTLSPIYPLPRQSFTLAGGHRSSQ